MRYAFLLWGLACLGCASTQLEDTAQRGDLASLERGIAESAANGEMSEAKLASLSLALINGELVRAKGELGAKVVQGLRPCAPWLLPELTELATQHDAAGAAATLQLVSLGELAADDQVKLYMNETEAAWRAVAARGATTAEHAQLRRKWFKDGDTNVRRAALEAALNADSEEDVGALLEVVRLDPDLMNRSLAARAALATGSEQAVLALRDYWPRATATERITYLEAWNQPAARAHGGERELFWAVETGSGETAIVAAALLAGDAGERGQVSRALLSRTLEHGSSAERELAVNMIRVEQADMAAALERYARTASGKLAALAWARLGELPGRRATALAELKKIEAYCAKSNDPSLPFVRHTLARFGDRSVVAPLQLSLREKSAANRLAAARALLSLGEHRSAAVTLADNESAVRRGFACSVVQRSWPRTK